MPETPLGEVILDPQAEVSQKQPGPVSQGFRAGLLTTKASAGGLLATVGDFLRSERLRELGLETSRSALEEAAPLQRRVEDIDSIGGLADFLKFGAGYSAGNLLPVLAGALIGRFGGGAVSRQLVGAAAKSAAKNIGTAAGALSVGFGQETGSIFPEAVEQGVEDPAARAISGGLVAGSLEALVPSVAVGRILGAASRVKAPPVRRALSASGTVGAAAGLGAAGEAGTEVLQTAVERIAAGQPVTGEEAISDFLNAGALGAIGGGGLGTITGVVEAARNDAQARALGVPVEPVAPQPADELVSEVVDEPISRPVPEPDIGIAGNILEELDALKTSRQAIIDRQRFLADEFSRPSTERTRSRQEIVKEGKLLEAQLRDIDARSTEIEKLRERQQAAAATPEYQPKARLIQPVPLDFRGLNDEEAIDAARQGNFQGGISQERSGRAPSGETSRPGARDRAQRQAASFTPEEEGLLRAAQLKRDAGLLITAAEAKALREYQRQLAAAAPPVEIEIPGRTRAPEPRAIETVQDRTRAPEPRVIETVQDRSRFRTRPVDAQSVDEATEEQRKSIIRNFMKRNFDDPGIMRPATRRSVESRLNRVVRDAVRTGNPRLAEQLIVDGAYETFEGKINPVDLDTMVDNLIRGLADLSLPESAQRQLFSRAATAVNTGKVVFRHFGNVPGGVTDPKRIGTGVRGADQAIALELDIPYTSAIIEGTQYREPEVQAKKPYIGVLDAADVYTPTDLDRDPVWHAAVAKVSGRYGPNFQAAFAQYMRDLRDTGYKAININGQLRIFTPTRVYEEPSVDQLSSRALKLIDAHAKNGGGTVGLTTGIDYAYTNMYAVSPYKEREFKIPGRDLDPQMLGEYVKSNADLLIRPDHALGSWYNEADNTTYLDVTVVVPGLEDAFQIARDNDQIAFFDLKAGVSIDVAHPIFDSAQSYNRANDIPPLRPIKYAQPDAKRQSDIARAYDALAENNLADPEVAAAYQALNAEVEQQFQHASKTFTFEPWTQEGEPYADSAAMRADVFNNRHLFVFSGGDIHPAMTAEQTFKFRAVHDLYGHAKTGFEFGPRGELNAFRAHAQMFSPLAIRALATETMGQNSWVNFGEQNKGLPPGERAFAVQKADLLPEGIYDYALADVRDSRAAVFGNIDKASAEKGRQVLAFMEKILGTPARLEVRLVPQAEGGAAGVTYLGRMKDVIELSLGARDIGSVAAHEGYHFLEARVLSKADRAVVSAAFRPGAPMYEQLTKAALAYDAANGTAISSEIESIPEEARAYGFEFWRRGELAAKGPVERVFRAIRNLLEKISNYLNGLGFTSVEDVFRAIENGEYARRDLAQMRSFAFADDYLLDIEPDALPGGELLYREKAASAAKGRPHWVKRASDVTRMRNWIRKLAIEGEAARDWHERSGRAILNWANGDVALATLMAKLISNYSPRTPVGSDLKKALESYALFSQGKEVVVGAPKDHIRTAVNIMRDGAPVTGIKRMNFFRNLMQQIDPAQYGADVQGATIDMWMAHAFGYANDVAGTISKSEYNYADAEVRRLARELGWTVEETQAAIWVSIKARANAVRSSMEKFAIERGWFENKPKKRKTPAQVEQDLFGEAPPQDVVRVLKKEHQREYVMRWMNMAASIPFDQAAFDKANYSYAEAFEDVRTGRLALRQLEESEDSILEALGLDVPEDGKATGGRPEEFHGVLFSRAATFGGLGELAAQVRDGKAHRTQLNAQIASILDDKSIPIGLRERFVDPALLSGVDSMKRFYWEYLASGVNLSRKSKGYRNVFNVLTTYTQVKNRRIARAVDQRLSEWRKGSTNEDRDVVSKALLERTSKRMEESSIEYQALLRTMTDKQRAMFEQAGKMIASELIDEFRAEQEMYKRVLPSEDYARWVDARQAQVNDLIRYGYFPERRYGDHVVYAYVEKDGKKFTVFFSQHERRAEADVELKHLQKALEGSPEVKIEYGFRYRAEYDAGVSYKQVIDTLQRNNIPLQQSEKERLAKALIAADSVRRNRIFRREDVAGASTDGMRVLAEFAVTMANKITYITAGDAVQDALRGVEVTMTIDENDNPIVDYADRPAGYSVWDGDGPERNFYRNIAENTVEFVLSPRDTNPVSRALRSTATLFFLGGSIAAGIVQLTSIPMNSVPWLMQSTSYTDAFARVVSAFKTTIANLNVLTDVARIGDRTTRIAGVDEVAGLRQALIVAAQDGTILDTEIFQIMGLTRGQELANSGLRQKAIDLWMYPFRKTEQINRLTTFIAAYKIGLKNKLGGRELYNFAQNAVYSTQFRYDDANRPGLARGPVASLLFTFKTYPIFVTETLVYLLRNNPSAGVAMMLSLMFMGGIEGLPFAEDIMDIVNFVSQRVFGSPFNVERALRNTLKNASEAVLGADLSNVFVNGLANELTGLNFAGRLGLGNIIPGTSLGAPGADYKDVVSEVLGPVGSLVQGTLAGADNMLRGNFEQAARQILPLAGQNLSKSWFQFQRGYATDAGGRKLVDVSGFEAFWQSLGFTSSALNSAYEHDRIDRRTLAFYNEVRDSFTRDLISALQDGDATGAREVVEAVKNWNKSNPDMRVALNASSIRQRLQLAGLPLNERTLRAMPKVLRSSSLARELYERDN